MPLLSIKNATLPNNFAVQEFALSAGEYVGVVGPASSGKSALLLALAGVNIEDTTCERTTEIDDIRIGYLPTSPSLIFSGMKSTVHGELDLSWQMAGDAPIDHFDAVRRLNLETLLDRDPFTLSGGEMVKVAVAILSAKKPVIWLLDQCFDWLAPEAVDELRAFFREELENQCAVVEVHSRSPEWVSAFDRQVFFDTGPKCVAGKYETIAKDLENKYLLTEAAQLGHQICSDAEFGADNSKTIAAVANLLSREKLPSPGRSTEATFEHEPCVRVREMQFTYDDGNFSLGPIDLSVDRGEAVAVVGANGSGKSTFLQCIARLLMPTGLLEIERHTPGAHSWEWAKSAIYCFQNPDDQLYCRTVLEEITVTLNSLGHSVPADLNEKMERLGILGISGMEPFHLPRPHRRLVGLAIGLLAGSPVVLLDEPTSGLDATQRKNLICEVRRRRAEGVVFFIVSHDHSFLTQVSSRVIEFQGGNIIHQTSIDDWPLAKTPIPVELSRLAHIPVSRVADLLNPEC